MYMYDVIISSPGSCESVRIHVYLKYIILFIYCVYFALIHPKPQNKS